MKCENCSLSCFSEIKSNGVISGLKGSANFEKNINLSMVLVGEKNMHHRLV